MCQLWILYRLNRSQNCSETYAPKMFLTMRLYSYSCSYNNGLTKYQLLMSISDLSIQISSLFLKLEVVAGYRYNVIW